VFVLQAFARTGRLDSAAWQSLRDTEVPRRIDRELPATDTVAPVWPRLTPSGVEPARDDSAEPSREHV